MIIYDYFISWKYEQRKLNNVELVYYEDHDIT